MSTLPPALQRLIAVQHQNVTAAQLDAVDVSRRRVRWLLDSGAWRRTAPGLYYTGGGAQPWLSRAWGAHLVSGPESVIGGTSAAHLHELLPAGPEPIRVFVPVDRSTAHRVGIIVTRSRLSRRTQTIAGLPCTTVPETILDCAETLCGVELEALIGRAFQRGKCNKEALGRALAGRRTVAQRQLLDVAAADAARGAHSRFELIYLRAVERPHGLPAAERQVRVGSALEWADIWYVGQRLLVELDGAAFHEGAPFRDRARDNRNSRNGCTTLRYGWAEVVGDPCRVALDVARNLAERGWDAAPFTSCGGSCTAMGQDPPHEPGNRLVR